MRRAIAQTVRAAAAAAAAAAAGVATRGRASFAWSGATDVLPPPPPPRPENVHAHGRHRIEGFNRVDRRATDRDNAVAPVRVPPGMRWCFACEVAVAAHRYEGHLQSAEHRFHVARDDIWASGLGGPPPADKALPPFHVWCVPCQGPVALNKNAPHRNWQEHLTSTRHLAVTRAREKGVAGGEKPPTEVRKLRIG